MKHHHYYISVFSHFYVFFLFNILFLCFFLLIYIILCLRAAYIWWVLLPLIKLSLYFDDAGLEENAEKLELSVVVVDFGVKAFSLDDGHVVEEGSSLWILQGSKVDLLLVDHHHDLPCFAIFGNPTEGWSSMQSVELLVVLLGGTLDHNLLVVEGLLHEGKVLEELNPFLLLLREVRALNRFIKLLWNHVWVLSEVLASRLIILQWLAQGID